MEQCFCLDASALIEMWMRRYSKYVTWFDPLWLAIAQGGAQGTVMTCRQVVGEVHNDQLAAWLKSCRGLVQEPVDGELEIVGQILADERTERLVDRERERPQADPFVIAQAEVRHGIVVTEEGIRRSVGRRPHIPDVCNIRGVPFTSVTGFIAALANRCGCSRHDEYKKGE